MKQKYSIYQIAFIAVLAALVFVATRLYIPLGSSRVQLGNAVCLLAGLLLGPVPGGLAAGIGCLLFDLTHGYDLIQCAITFVSKFAMAYVAGKIAFGAGKNAADHKRNVVACVVGAWTYVALYMLKTFIYQRFVYGFPADAVWVTMGAKFPASAINAVAAMIVAPILYTAIAAALKSSGLLERMRTA